MSSDDLAPQAVTYAAKSTEDKHGSIQTQLEDCRAMAEREGWEIVGEFQDEGFSAYSGNRGPGLEQAKELAARVARERDTVCYLVAQHSDRLARGAGDKPGAADSLVEIWHAMRRQNVHLRSVQNDSMLGDPLLVAAASKLAHEESQRKSDAVKAGMKRLREAGKWTGGQPAYGTEHRDGELLPMKSRAPIVKRMFAECIAGRSQLAIARALVADGIPTARDGDWHAGTVRSILANPVYVKLGIIDAETWAKAEALRTSRARTSGRGRPPAGQHLFRKGLLRCGCGEAMVPRTQPNRASAPTEVYRCYGRLRDPDSCSMAPVPREMIDSAVYAYFENVGLDVEATREQLADSRDRKLGEVRAIQAAAEQELHLAEERLSRVRRDYHDGKLTADDWNDHRDQLTEELQAAKAEVERLSSQEQEVESWGELRDVEADVLHKLADLRRAIAGEVRDAEGIDAVRAAMARLFDHLVLHPLGSDWYRPEDPKPSMRVGESLETVMHIELVVRESAVDRYEGDDGVFPVIRREPLQQAENNYVEGFGR